MASQPGLAKKKVSEATPPQVVISMEGGFGWGGWSWINGQIVLDSINGITIIGSTSLVLDLNPDSDGPALGDLPSLFPSGNFGGLFVKLEVAGVATFGPKGDSIELNGHLILGIKFTGSTQVFPLIMKGVSIQLNGPNRVAVPLAEISGFGLLPIASGGILPLPLPPLPNIEGIGDTHDFHKFAILDGGPEYFGPRLPDHSFGHDDSFTLRTNWEASWPDPPHPLDPPFHLPVPDLPHFRVDLVWEPNTRVFDLQFVKL